MTKRSFVPFEYECQECKDTIHSSYSGEFVTCSCGKSFVDQTEYYTRLGGDVVPICLGEYKQ